MQAQDDATPPRTAQGCAGFALAALLAWPILSDANPPPSAPKPVQVAAPAGITASTPSPSDSRSDGSPGAEVTRLLRSLTAPAAGAAPRGRVEIAVGQLDPRLKLAPCQRVEPYLPAGQRAWGKVRVGLRCAQGAVAWNVYLPVTVHVWAPAVVVTVPVAADATLRATDLGMAEVDLAERPATTFDDIGVLVGRRTAVALAPGAAVRTDVLKLRQWFEAGATVNVIAQGDGFSVSSEAQALSPGLEGQTVRLRTESGRLISATPTGDRRAELRL